MQRQPDKPIRDWDKRLHLSDRLVYLPGALVLAYGFWLTLSI